MFVWLHTNSPPQHIASIPEQELHPDKGGLPAYLAITNARRGIRAKFAGVFENNKGEVSVHIFDTVERAVAWADRNIHTQDVLLSTED